MARSVMCSVAGCDEQVQKDGHTLCYEHWKLKHKAQEAPAAYQVEKEVEKISADIGGMLKATDLGEYFKLDARQINTILHELGWIEKEGKGWKPTALGEKLKAQRQMYRNTTPYVVWHSDICKSRILQNAANELLDVEAAQISRPQSEPSPEEAAEKPAGFREAFPAPHRTSDGHYVRSMPEIQIDNWLYANRIPHAYEPLVPVEQEMYCDFYLPEHRVFIEYWGMEDNPRYASRKKKKLEIYHDNNLQLIEIQKKHISGLDDYLTPLLVKLGYKLM